MHQLQTNAQLEALRLAGVGFVFNDFTSGPSGARSNVLHTADCRWIPSMLNPRDPHGRPSVPKLFFETVDESHLWLRANRGPEDTPGSVAEHACRVANPVDRHGRC